MPPHPLLKYPRSAAGHDVGHGRETYRQKSSDGTICERTARLHSRTFSRLFHRSVLRFSRPSVPRGERCAKLDVTINDRLQTYSPSHSSVGVSSGHQLSSRCVFVSYSTPRRPYYLVNHPSNVGCFCKHDCCFSPTLCPVESVIRDI